MKTRVLLILPPFERFMGYSRYYCHPGLLSLGGVIKEAGYEVLIYDADHDPSGKSYNPIERLQKYDKYIAGLNNPRHHIWEEIHGVIADFKPRFIGISVVSSALKSAEMIARLSRSIDPKIMVIAGGVHATFRPDDCLRFADFVVTREGEAVIEGILQGRFGKGIVTGSRIEDPDSLPLPAYDSIRNLNGFDPRDLSLLVSGRGCPFSCAFCCSPGIWERRLTRKSVRSFISEMELLRNVFGVTDFFIADDAFCYDRKWLSDFLAEIAGLEVSWRCLGRVDRIDEELMEEMSESGCRNIKIGIESGSQRILDIIDKKITVEDVLRCDEIMRKYDINWSAFFMIGFPGETEEDMLKTKSLIGRISAKSITVSIFTPYPGNRLYDSSNLDFELYSPHSPHNNFTGTMSDEDFLRLVYDVTGAAYTGYIEHTNEGRLK